MKIRSLCSLLLALAAHVGFAAQAEDIHSIAFSDPGKPGTLKINFGRGELQIVGSDTREVSVRSEAKATNSKPRKDGLREISTATTFVLSEKENVVSLDSTGHEGRGSNSRFHISVPRATTVLVRNGWSGDITCHTLSGDIEINSLQGDVRLGDVAGGIVVGTMNGEIEANIRELQDGKPLSFTCMSGEVVVRVPESAKANVRLRTQNGSVLTDFAENALVTKTEAVGTTGRFRGTPGGITLRGRNVLSTDVQEGIREATELSATAAREAFEAVKEGLEAARFNSEEARRQMDMARRQLDQARSELERKASTRSGQQTALDKLPTAPQPPAEPSSPAAPLPPKLTMPTLSGGKLVTGTLNGGGPEISIATMNGDVVLRKLQPQP